MNKGAEDRRVRKTKRALREGLAELLMEKELRHITVRELSDKVDIHRATFYAHYTDIYDLYEQMEDTLVDELGAILVSDPSHSYEQVFQSIVDYVSDNTRICRMFLIKNRSGNFQKRISSFLEEKYLDFWQYEMGNRGVTEEWKLLARYHIQGCLAIVAAWAENDYAFAKEKILDLIIQVDAHFDGMPCLETGG